MASSLRVGLTAYFGLPSTKPCGIRIRPFRLSSSRVTLPACHISLVTACRYARWTRKGPLFFFWRSFAFRSGVARYASVLITYVMKLGCNGLLGSLGGKAVAAVDRPISTRLKWHFRLFTAVSANGLKHAPGPAARVSGCDQPTRPAHAVFTLTLALTPTLPTTRGLIAEPFLCVKLLLTSSEYEFCATVTTFQIFVDKSHDIIPRFGCARSPRAPLTQYSSRAWGNGPRTEHLVCPLFKPSVHSAPTTLRYAPTSYTATPDRYDLV